MRQITRNTTILWFAGFAAFCQTPATQPEFDVASVRPNKSGTEKPSMVSDPGRINYTNVALKDCIKAAYGIKDYQLAGADRLGSERYDITAKIPSGTSPDQVPVMLQTLLADRFKLAFHREKKDMPAYALVAAKNGPKLNAAEGDGPGKQAYSLAGVVFQKTSMAALAEYLSRLPSIQRPVVDLTGISGVFDFTLKIGDGGSEGSPEFYKKALMEWMQGTAVFTDLQEQLGLKLDAQKRPVEVLVIDHAEKPSVN
jgi:uncharacterized protein (TIGR03435 family)